jgi:Flp pilus assembly pilin Flp
MKGVHMKLINNLRNRIRKNIIKGQSGQGATEYILLLVVIVGLVMMFGPKIKTAISGKVGDLEKGMETIKAE